MRLLGLAGPLFVLARTRVWFCSCIVRYSENSFGAGPYSSSNCLFSVHLHKIFMRHMLKLPPPPHWLNL